MEDVSPVLDLFCKSCKAILSILRKRVISGVLDSLEFIALECVFDREKENCRFVSCSNKHICTYGATKIRVTLLFYNP